jgi:metallophosphoesterase (TIGR00282 family)
MVGKTGRTAVWTQLPGLISDFRLDFVVVNGENAAGGFGITEEIFRETVAAGADVVTTGNHVWDQREALTFAPRQDRFLRPANYPKGTPGRGAGVFSARNGARVMVANVMGRVFMHPELDDPFRAAENEIAACPLGTQADAVIFDFHAEATSEKMCFGHFLDGRASAVIGTHTHQPTADHQILTGGTAYISDAGMCGDYDSSLGLDKEEPLGRFLTKLPKARFEAASGPATLCGVGVDISDRTGLAERIAPFRRGPRLEETVPCFWA